MTLATSSPWRLRCGIGTRQYSKLRRVSQRDVRRSRLGNSLLEIAAPNPAAVDMLSSRLDHLRSRLSSQMLHHLSSPEIRKSSVVRLVGLLSRIDSANAAKDTFLKARREVMMKRVREIRSEGDTSIYINELAIVCFTIIRHTGDWYMTAFHEQAMASGKTNLLAPDRADPRRFRHLVQGTD